MKFYKRKKEKKIGKNRGREKEQRRRIKGENLNQILQNLHAVVSSPDVKIACRTRDTTGCWSEELNIQFYFITQQSVILLENKRKILDVTKKKFFFKYMSHFSSLKPCEPAIIGARM